MYACKYTIERLSSILHGLYSGETSFVKGLVIDFEDAAVVFTGTFTADYEYIRGDYYTPCEYRLISQWVDVHECTVSYNDETFKDITNELEESIQSYFRK